MNPRQQRGLLFIVLAVLIGAGVFVAVARYVGDVASQVGNATTVFRARSAIDPYTPLSAQNLEAVEVPQRWTAPASRLQLRQLEGRRAGFRIEPGTVISSDMLIPPSALSATEREIGIYVNAVTGIAGRVRPGDSVDIYAVFADVPGLPKESRVLVRNVRVVTIGGKQSLTVADAAEGLKQNEVIPVTLALEPQDALSVTYATSFAKEVRLVGLPTDVGASRAKEGSVFDAGNLGGQAVAQRQN